VAAADGASWLFTGNAEAPLLRFNPWRARFETMAPRFSEPPAIVEAPLALDPGAFVWIEEAMEPRLRGLRTGVRHRFTNDLALLVTTDPFDSGWPLHLAPSHAGAATYEERELLLTTLPVWLTDVELLDFDLSVTFSGAAPVVYLDEYVVGCGERPWPEHGGGDTLEIERRGTRLTLRSDAGTLRYDDAPSTRVRIGFAARGNDEETRMTGVEVVRVRG